MVSSWDFGKRFFPNHWEKKLCINLFGTVFSTNMSYCVLWAALQLERKINSKVWACSAGIWDGSSMEVPQKPVIQLAIFFPGFLFSLGLCSEWICHGREVFQPGKHWFFKNLFISFLIPFVVAWPSGRVDALQCGVVGEHPPSPPAPVTLAPTVASQSSRHWEVDTSKA